MYPFLGLNLGVHIYKGYPDMVGLEDRFPLLEKSYSPDQRDRGTSVQILRSMPIWLFKVQEETDGIQELKSCSLKYKSFKNKIHPF